MILHSTNGKSPKLTFAEGVANGLAPDGGLYMPDEFPRLPQAFFRNIQEMTLKEIAFVICNTLFGDMLSAPVIKEIVDDALPFPVPLRHVETNRYLLELFHGPTLSFKDIGARFMARLMERLVPCAGGRKVIIATSGDSGGAVADAFRGMGAHVYVLFPSGILSAEQIAQFAMLQDVTAVEVDGTFDECQALVKETLQADAAGSVPSFTSGNSINLARELPAMIPFFHAYARALEAAGGSDAKVVVSVPCGNLGSLAAGLMAKKMGLPVTRFIAANNANDIFVEYLKTGGFTPQQALITIARAMDVGNPSNIARIIDLYGGNLPLLRRDVEGFAYSNEEIAGTMQAVYSRHGLLVDPQGATALRAIDRHLADDEIGVALVGAHPAKFRQTVAEITGVAPDLPPGYGNSLVRHQRIMRIPPTMGALHRVLAAKV